jgi:hypothetical protein
MTTVVAGHVVRAIQDNKVSPGVLGFLVVAALGVATWLLIRSMNRQIHKIDFSEDAIDRDRRAAQIGEPDAPGPDGPTHAAADGEDGPRP